MNQSPNAVKNNKRERGVMALRAAALVITAGCGLVHVGNEDPDNVNCNRESEFSLDDYYPPTGVVSLTLQGSNKLQLDVLDVARTPHGLQFILDDNPSNPALQTFPSSQDGSAHPDAIVKLSDGDSWTINVETGSRNTGPEIIIDGQCAR
jgi:hypothetical protein